ncbi:MAG: DUF4190 domain-containing protein [Porcipelethomonas sp.]
MDENQNVNYNTNPNPYYMENQGTNDGQYNTANNYSGQNYYSGGNGYYDGGMGYNGYNNGGVPVPPKKKGLAITSMILGILSILFCCSPYLCLVLAVISAVMGIIALVKKQAYSGMSITGIITSAISIIMSVILLVTLWGIVSEFGQFMKDFMKAAMNQEEVVEEYERTGELPDYLQKYDEGEWGEFFDSMFDGGFEEYFYDVFVESQNEVFDDEGTRQYLDDFESEFEDEFENEFKKEFKNEFSDVY